MRIALYTRLSPNPDKKDTENQERQLREFVSRNVGWEIVRTFTDIHLSGSKKGKDRPKFTLMMLEASQKKFDMILFWALDRLTREGMLATLQYLDQLEKWGIKYKSYTEPHIDSLGPFNDIFLSIASTFAKLERSKLIERTKVGLETARLKGKRLGRQYATVVTETRPNPVILQDVISLRNEGKSLREIAETYEGVGASTIYRLLKRYEAGEINAL